MLPSGQTSKIIKLVTQEGAYFAITMYWALKVEKLKKENDVQTYKGIIALSEGKKLDELHKQVDVSKVALGVFFR